MALSNKQIEALAQKRIGHLLDNKYRISNLVGHGGMSIVYEAFDIRLRKQWAVKEFLKTDDAAKDEIFKQKLIDEATMMKDLDHPAMPRIVDIIEADDTIFIVMDFVPGYNLQEIMKMSATVEADGSKTFQPFDQEDVINWGIQLCDVLAYLHSNNIVYRDMKPANIMLRDDNTVCLVDFGIARKFDENKTKDTTLLGTRVFAAPEQFDADVQTDWRADIYALGVTLHYLVTAKNPDIYAQMPIREVRPDLNLDPGLERVIQGCIQRDPKKRYQDCKRIAYDLQNHEKLTDDYRGALKKKVATFRNLIIAASMFLVLSIVGFVMSSRERASTFDAYMSQGNNLVVDETTSEMDSVYVGKLSAYKNAIDVDASNREPYDKVLEMVVRDGEISAEEANTVYLLLEDKAKKSCSAYGDLCYEFAKIYFGYTTNWQQASSWFNAALSSGTLTEEQSINAATYISICDFKNNLSMRDRLGDTGESAMYVEYWNNLVEACNSLEGAAVIPHSKLKLYELIVDSCSSEAFTIPFLVGGISSEELSGQVKYVEEQTEALSGKLSSSADLTLQNYILTRCDGTNEDSAGRTPYDVISDSESALFSTTSSSKGGE